MKKFFIMSFALALCIQTLTLPALAMSEAIAKCENEGESVEVKVSLSQEAKQGVFAYQAILNYDPEMLEYAGISQRYFSADESKNTDYGNIYKSGSDYAAYENIKAEAGSIRYASSVINKYLVAPNENIISITFKAKQKGESFINISDEKAMIDTDSSLEEADTYFTVISPTFTSVSKKLADEIKEPNIKYDLTEAKRIRVDYVNPDASISIRNERISINTVNPFESAITPVPVRKHIDESISPVKMFYVDREDGKIKFSDTEFGTYYIVPCRVVVNDMADGETGTEAVKSFAASGVISGGMNFYYRPDDKITRAEFIKLLVEVCGLVDEKARCIYDDVSISDWYYPYIASAREAGLIGDGSDMIYPEGSISGIEAEELIQKAFKTSAEYNYGGELTRREAADLIYKNIDTALK